MLLRESPLEIRQECLESLPNEAGKGTIISSGGGENGAPLEWWQDHWCSSRVDMAMSGKFFSCCKGVKEPFEVQEGSCNFTRDAAAEKALTSPGEENLLVFLELCQVPLE